MAIVLYVPGGLAGLVMLHAPIVRARAAGRVLRAYALALLPTLAIALGAIALIEMAYRRATQPEAGPRMRLFWIAMDTSTPWPWLGAALLAATGYIAWRYVRLRVLETWNRAADEAGMESARG
jgi:branched-chain amino acid transport system permease protein